MLPGIDADAAFDGRPRSSAASSTQGSTMPASRCALSAGLSTYPYDGARCVPAPARGRPGPLPGQGERQEPRRSASATSCAAPRPARCRRSGVERGRGGGVDGSVLVDAMDASAAIWAEESVDGVLERLSKSVTFVVGATGALISKVEGERLADAVRHSMRDIDLGEDTAYLISDFPVTKEVLETDVGQVDLVPRRRSRPRRGVRPARAADELRAARAARRARPLVGARGDLRHAPAAVHAARTRRWPGSSSARPAGGSSRSATSRAASAACRCSACRSRRTARLVVRTTAIGRSPGRDPATCGRAGSRRHRRADRRGAASVRRG